jgi:Adenylate and Guanylate cyclase catalytic domain
MAKWKFNFSPFFYVQQVETVGDKYMAVSGLPDICENHAVSIARLALDMIDKADSVLMGDQPVVSVCFLFFVFTFSSDEFEIMNSKYFEIINKCPTNVFVFIPPFPPLNPQLQIV